MSRVTLSGKFKVTIPKDIRESAGLKAGTVMEVITYGNRIEFIPLRPMKALKGIFKGIDTDIERDEDRA